MAYLTKQYYVETFHGQTVPDDQFDRLADMASDVIDAVVLVPIDAEKHDMDKIAKATAYEMEYLYQEGGLDAITGKATSGMVQSEKLDEYSISESQSDTTKQQTLTVNGIPISALAVAILRSLGLMCRWWYAGRGLHYDGD